MGAPDQTRVPLVKSTGIRGAGGEPTLTAVPSGQPKVHRVPIDCLQAADSPRLCGEDTEHILRLAATERQLPPIIVHRHTMRVIDGMHRVRVAKLRGQAHIDVAFFDGTDQEAFVLAVRSNITHGLPSWSDRLIASVTGLSASTVRSLRQRVGAPETGEDGGRVGRDGRRRPLDPTVGRLAASRVVGERPEASVREIAREAGISLATARDVRARVRRGEDPLPAMQRVESPAEDGSLTESGGTRTSIPARRPGIEAMTAFERISEYAKRLEREGAQDVASLLDGLASDPALRFTDSGRAMVRWLTARARDLERWREVAATVPPHSAYVITNLAIQCACEWLQFAEQLEQQTELMA
jgi:hypothetical protein